MSTSTIAVPFWQRQTLSMIWFRSDDFDNCRPRLCIVWFEQQNLQNSRKPVSSRSLKQPQLFSLAQHALSEPESGSRRRVTQHELIRQAIDKDLWSTRKAFRTSVLVVVPFGVHWQTCTSHLTHPPESLEQRSSVVSPKSYSVTDECEICHHESFGGWDDDYDGDGRPAARDAFFVASGKFLCHQSEKHRFPR